MAEKKATLQTFRELPEARSRETPPERLLALAQSHSVVQGELVRNPNTPPEALRIIANERPEERIQIAIAKHPNTPPELLSEYAVNAPEEVQLLVAVHPNTPEPLLHAFAIREICFQRAVANNPLLPIEVIVRLASLKDNAIEAALAQNPNTPPALALKCGERFPSSLMKNPSLSLILLEGPELLANFSAELVRALLYLPTPPDWLWKAAVSHPDVWVRSLAARHKKLPGWALQDFLKDPAPKVRSAAQKNPNYAPDAQP